MATPNRLWQKRSDASGVKTGRKRKAPTPAGHPQPAKKKARLATQENPKEDLPPTVAWVPQDERPGVVGHISEGKDAATTGPFSLLVDWRNRIGNFKPEAGKTKTVKELEVVNLGDGDDGDVDEEDEEDYENDEDNADEQAFEENLKRALTEKLQASGMGNGMDQGTLLQYAMRMLSNESDSDDIAGELASSLLGKVAEGSEAAGITGWLGEQGVNLDGEEGDEEASDWQSATGDISEEKGITSTSPPPTLPVARRPPTPDSTQSSNGSGKSSKTIDKPDITTAQTTNSAAFSSRDRGNPSGPKTSKSRKRKAEAPKQRAPGELDQDPELDPPPPKRVASYATSTASSRSKVTPSTAPSTKPRTRNTGK